MTKENIENKVPPPTQEQDPGQAYLPGRLRLWCTWRFKQAYLRLARRYHPGLNPSPEAKREFNRITRAFDLIMKHGDFLKLQRNCDIVEVRKGYAEFLEMHKRDKVLPGIEPDPPPFNPAYARKDELGEKMQKLGTCMIFRCPAYKLRANCDRATGFEGVEETHHEIQAKVIARFFGGGDPISVCTIALLTCHE